MRHVPVTRIVSELYRKGGSVGVMKHIYNDYPEHVITGLMATFGLIGFYSYVYYKDPYRPMQKYPGGIAIVRHDDPLVEFLPKYKDNQ